MAILLIHAGGTIGMARTGAGFAPADGVVEHTLGRLQSRGCVPPGVDVVTLSPLIDSASATPTDWNRITRLIYENHDRYDGVVVTHGTDTMAYTGAAACFALPGLNRPVVLTGSMLPLTVADSDGARNLTDALTAAQSLPPGVWLQFAGKTLSGSRIRKSHSHAFDAFAAGPTTAPPRIPASDPTFRTVATPKVAVLAVAPGTPTEIFEYTAGFCDGIVLRCYGSGTVPASAGLRRGLECALRREVPVLAVSQCPEGGMEMGTYAAAAILVEHNVIDGRDMTVEAAFTKLNYVLSDDPDPLRRRHRLEVPECGEFTP